MTETPLPKGQLVCSILLQISEALNVNVLFPFLPFMVEHVGKGGPNLGTYCGILAATFCFGQLLSSLVWAKLADIFGRKTTLIWGTIGTGVGMLVFGMSETYEHAIAGRLLSGALCGNLLVLKTFLAEITDETNRGAGFSILAIAWSMGTVVAPLIGGMLSEPSRRYPDIFPEEGLFGRYPYLLPCLLCVIYNFVSAMVVACIMVESRIGSFWGGESGLNRPTSYGKLATAEETEMVNLDTACEEEQDEQQVQQVQENELTEDLPDESGNLLWRPHVVAATGNYGIVCFATVILDETFPLFLKLDEGEGGFSYRSHDIGLVLSISGILMFFFTVTFLPKLANGDKPQLFRMGGLFTVPTCFLYPLGTIIVRAIGGGASIEELSITSYAYLITVKFVQSVAVCLCFTAVVVQVNESVAERELADVNAMGQMFASLARCVGPGVGGLLWSLSVNADFIVANFLVTAVLLVGAMALNHFVVAKFPKRPSSKKLQKLVKRPDEP